jgi:hypothetical protein
LAAIQWQTALSAKNVSEAHFLSSTIQAQKVAIYYGEVGIIIRQSTKSLTSLYVQAATLLHTEEL